MVQKVRFRASFLKKKFSLFHYNTVKTVQERNVSIPQDKTGFGELAMEEIYRLFAEGIDEYFDRKISHFHQRFEESMEKIKKK